MAAYKVFFKESVEKDLSKIPQKDLEIILYRIKMLIEDPRPANCEKFTGQERCRIRQGQYRILYSIKDQELTVWVVKVGHRKDVYK